MLRVVRFVNRVEAHTAAGLMWRCGLAVNEGATSLRLDVASPGGEIPIALALVRYLKSLSVPLHFHNIRQVDSAAIPIFLAAVGHRTAVPGASFFFHPITRQDADGRKLEYGALDAIGRAAAVRTADWYVRQCVAHTQIDPKHLKEVLLGQAPPWTMDTSEARSLGVIHLEIG